MTWKNDFLRLYTSEVISDFEKALELKREHIPQKLYRYRSLSDKSMEHRFGEIVRGELFLSHPKDLNDPFEACAHLSSMDPSKYIINKKAYQEQFAGKIPEDKFNEIFSDENWFKRLLTYVATVTADQVNVEKNEKALEKVTLYGMEMLNAHLNETARKIVRFASFSTTATNVPMWHHYTEGHRGICLEYDTAEITNIYQKNMMFPVFYVDKLPDVVSMMLKNAHPKFSLFEYITMHKLKDWNYEHEWRLIHNVGSWYYSCEDVPNDFYIKGQSIQFIRPSKIIMGIQISDAHRVKLEEMATIANIPLVQAKQTEYGLSIC